ncbi:DNA adenine methylase [Noviherbaspirillum aridicola]|uniref:Uncharacterized protein n=1 Tax=Noviherbaspirillum aridicola TaxID=2849687 RepID=A0ABQ4PZ93_9BURK|nr:DNA adenine methylase [Noviherbaspirillum aridicola]GIZ50208.1 hypothetical protein NCCP691_02220 [Noviherbaspirillum aridicola]
MKRLKAGSDTDAPAAQPPMQLMAIDDADWKRVDYPAFPMLGSKRSLLQTDAGKALPTALLAAVKARDFTRFLDLFAGTGFVSLWVRSHKPDARVVLNELDAYRHLTHRYIIDNHEAVVAELEAMKTEIKELFYRTAHSAPPADAGSADAEPVAAIDPQEVAEWIASSSFDREANRRLSAALREYLLQKLRANMSDDGTPLDVPLNAALYLIAQHNLYMPNGPVNIRLGTGYTMGAQIAHPTGVTMGSGGSIMNRMIGRKLEDSPHVREPLLVDAKIDEIVTKLRYVAGRMQGATVSRGNGWEKLAEVGQGDLAMVDPEYWLPEGKLRGKGYTNGSQPADESSSSARLPELSETGFIEQVVATVMPAWERQGRLILTNKESEYVRGNLEKLGFLVLTSAKAQTTARSHTRTLREIVAINFKPQSGAEMLPYQYPAALDPALLPSVHIPIAANKNNPALPAFFRCHAADTTPFQRCLLRAGISAAFTQDAVVMENGTGRAENVEFQYRRRQYEISFSFSGNHLESCSTSRIIGDARFAMLQVWEPGQAGEARAPDASSSGQIVAPPSTTIA